MTQHNHTPLSRVKNLIRNEKRILLETLRQPSVTGRTFEPPVDEAAERDAQSRSTAYWQEEFERNHER